MHFPRLYNCLGCSVESKPKGCVYGNIFFIASFFSEFTSEEQEGLATHNKFRKVHQVPLMTLDKQMSEQATEYAEKLARLGRLEHSQKTEGEDQGENLAFGCSFDKAQTIKEAVTNW